MVSVASIRGRARGAGSEFVLACDLRFASRENTLLGQFEVGVGVVPAFDDSRELFGRPAQQAHLARLQELGFNTDSDLERSLGRRVVEGLTDA